MAYPLNNSFETATPANYWDVRSQWATSAPLYDSASYRYASLTYNAAEQAYDLTGGRGQNLAIINEPLSADMWFEADLELVDDPSNRRHFGLWITTGWSSSPAQGFRFFGLDNYWGLTYWAREFYWETGLGTIYRDSELFLNDPGLNPAVGTIITMRMEVSANPFNKWERYIRCYVNGVMILQTNWYIPWWSDSSYYSIYQNLFRPGVFVYDGTVRIHAIRAAEPSGIPEYGGPVVNKALGLSHLGFPYGSAGWDAGEYKFNRLQSPVDAEQNTANQQMKYAYHGWMHQGRANHHFRGDGSIIGTVKERVGTVDRAFKRRVQLIDQASSLVVAETWSDAQGNYRFDKLDRNLQWTVVSFDYKNNYRAVIADNLRATVDPNTPTNYVAP